MIDLIGTTVSLIGALFYIWQGDVQTATLYVAYAIFFKIK